MCHDAVRRSGCRVAPHPLIRLAGRAHDLRTGRQGECDLHAFDGDALVFHAGVRHRHRVGGAVGACLARGDRAPQRREEAESYLLVILNNSSRLVGKRSYGFLMGYSKLHPF